MSEVGSDSIKQYIFQTPPLPNAKIHFSKAYVTLIELILDENVVSKSAPNAIRGVINTDIEYTTKMTMRFTVDHSRYIKYNQTTIYPKVTYYHKEPYMVSNMIEIYKNKNVNKLIQNPYIKYGILYPMTTTFHEYSRKNTANLFSEISATELIHKDYDNTQLDEKCADWTTRKQWGWVADSPYGDPQYPHTVYQ